MVFLVLKQRLQVSCFMSTRATNYLKPGKQSYLSVPGEAPLVGMTVGTLVDRCTSQFPDSPAIVVSTPKEVRRNYHEFKKEVGTNLIKEK